MTAPALPGYGWFDVPPTWDWPSDCRVFIGGCYERGPGSSFRAAAHAHDKARVVCVRSPRRIFVEGTGRPSRVMFHELAHIISGHGHDDHWRAVMRNLGQPIPARYQRKERK